MTNPPGFINPRVAAYSAQAAAEAVDAKKLDDLTDVDFTTPPTDGQAMIFNAALGLWLPASLPAPGATNLDELTDVDTTTSAPTDGQVMTYHAASGLWLPASLPAPAPGATDLDGLTDVDTSTTAPTDGQVLVYHAASSQWLPGSLPAPGATDLDQLSDVDTSTTAPIDGQVLVYHAATGQWLPGSLPPTPTLAWTLKASWLWSAAVANVDFIGLGAFNELLLVFRGVNFSAAQLPQVTLSTDNGATFDTSTSYIEDSSGASANRSAILLGGGNPTIGGLMHMLMNVAGAYKSFFTPQRATSGSSFTYVGGGAGLSVINALRFNGISGGNLTSGKIFIFTR